MLTLRKNRGLSVACVGALGLFGCSSASETGAASAGAGGDMTGSSQVAGMSDDEPAGAGDAAADGGGTSGGSRASIDNGGGRSGSGTGGRSAGGTGATSSDGGAHSVAGAAAGAGKGGAGGSGAAAHETVYVSGYGSDIFVFQFDTQTGMLKKQSSVDGGMSPSYMAFAPNHKFAYAINEADGADSKVVAFSIDAGTGKLTQLNSALTGGDGAPHLAVHPSGKWIVVAHYNSGETSVLPINDDGTVGTAGTPNKGPNNGCQNAHQAVFDLSGDHLLVPCLGSNYVIQFKFNAGQLSYNDPATVAVAGGPRHLALDPQEHYAYVISELESLITSFKYDAATGKLSDPQMINSYDKTKGKSAQIVVHAGGKWLYASNRTESSIGWFSIDANGRPHPVGFTTDQIATPRDFSIDPSGAWLIAANQDGDQNVLVFQIDPNDGHLTRKTSAATGGNPTFTQALVLTP